MHGFLKKVRFFADVDIALFCFFLTVLLQWVILREFAGFLIRPFHVTISFLLISLLFTNHLLVSARHLLKNGNYFFAIVFFFVLMEMISQLWVKNIIGGVAIIFKQSLYILMGFSIAIKLSNINSNKIIKTVFFGCLFGVVVFF